MSVAEAWLVLIAGVSLLGGNFEDAAKETTVVLNRNTCNRVKSGTKIDKEAFGLVSSRDST